MASSSDSSRPDSEKMAPGGEEISGMGVGAEPREPGEPGRSGQPEQFAVPEPAEKSEESEESEKVHHQAFSISQLSTYSVTIYPSCAAIVRDLEKIEIKPGRTEITLLNLTPLADPNSLKIEGHGTSAVVTDITIDLIPHRVSHTNASFDDSSDSDSSSSDEDSLQPAELKSITKEKLQLIKEINNHTVAQEVYNERLKYLQESMSRIASNAKTVPEEDLQRFGGMRMQIHEELQKTASMLEVAQKALFKVLKKEAKLLRRFDRSRAAARDARKQRRLERQDKKLEKKNQQLEIPENVYRVRITIEDVLVDAGAVVGVASFGKPRKRSQDIDDMAKVREKGPFLRISYITTGASWTPHYDLRLDTQSRSGLVTYRAQFSNRTGEVWRDAAVTLTTSQNNFSGVEDKVPWMSPWNVTFLSAASYNARDGGLYSAPEWYRLIQDPTNSEVMPTATAIAGPHQGGMPGEQAGMTSIPPSPSASVRPDMARYGTRKYLSASRSEKGYAEVSARPALGQHRASASSSSSSPISAASQTEIYDKLKFATANAESHGMTTTYELPGRRTITSSKLERRHVITEVPLDGVEFSHISVPKLRAAVFLKARIYNKSKVSLLSGKAGLTLDSSFLGSTVLPLCVPGNHVDVPLGIDESIQVYYAKPTKKSSSQGLMMMKEAVVNYSRSIRVHSARRGRVKLLVLDQIPVSDDERLRIGLLQPRGLRTEGDEVQVADGVVGLKENGELWWEAEMKEPGDAVLSIEYEARLPVGCKILAR
ncbi:Similar to Protein F37C4.5; acc. no. O44400 [Pyronema omphalodes CBS 100304]|uniref:Similar to Protein F37C4.5 acc. no. O44400 n=1 Tax=Pyronema omphalodes (strain CBS 100304) TaxID=1076935 RepID=U4KYB1_PYROM|nr:Similar to Protein F37C4.5; acc. no. O44400 [Pyronema omphalodes CBS 100304]